MRPGIEASLRGKFSELPPDAVDTIVDIAEAGYRHGLEGFYFHGHYSSDADWVYGIGDTINRLETRLGFDSGEVFDVYTGQHGEGLADGGHLNDDDEAAA
jgi:hypothetical protein